MPISFLNSYEKQQYQEIPKDIEEEYLIRFFLLSENDLIFIRSFYNAINRTAIAIIMGMIRHIGFVPNGPSDHINVQNGQLFVSKIISFLS